MVKLVTAHSSFCVRALSKLGRELSGERCGGGTQAPMAWVKRTIVQFLSDPAVREVTFEYQAL